MTRGSFSLPRCRRRPAQAGLSRLILDLFISSLCLTGIAAIPHEVFRIPHHQVANGGAANRGEGKTTWMGTQNGRVVQSALYDNHIGKDQIKQMLENFDNQEIDPTAVLQEGSVTGDASNIGLGSRTDEKSKIYHAAVKSGIATPNTPPSNLRRLEAGNSARMLVNQSGPLRTTHISRKAALWGTSSNKEDEDDFYGSEPGSPTGEEEEEEEPPSIPEGEPGEEGEEAPEGEFGESGAADGEETLPAPEGEFGEPGVPSEQPENQTLATLPSGDGTPTPAAGEENSPIDPTTLTEITGMLPPLPVTPPPTLGESEGNTTVDPLAGGLLPPNGETPLPPSALDPITGTEATMEPVPGVAEEENLGPPLEQPETTEAIQNEAGAPMEPVVSETTTDPPLPPGEEPPVPTTEAPEPPLEPQPPENQEVSLSEEEPTDDETLQELEKEAEEEKDKEEILEEELVREEREVRRIGGFGVFLAIVAMIFTAHQMSENPDGIYASCCRLIITLVGCGFKMVLMPFRSAVGGGGSRGYGHLPVNTIDSYRDPYRPGANGSMELS